MAHIVLVGGGVASTYAAAQLRTLGYNGPVTLFSDETERPYDHVPLSKDYLTGGPGYHELYLRPDAFYREHRIDLRLDTPVTAIDPPARTVTLGNGERLEYSAVLLATGASARRLDIPGAQKLDGVRYVRTLKEATALRRELRTPQRIVVIGGGFLGCEVAASAKTLGADVTLVCRDRLPLLHAVGEEIAEVYHQLHVEHGVHVLTDSEAVALHGTDRVEQVVLHDGTVLDTDVVVVAIGAVPNTALAAQAGLKIANGIVTDATLATSHPGVYAAGDVASVWNPHSQRHERREHFNTARTQGKTAARNMLGEAVSYDAVPFFFSDQYDLWMEHSGDIDPEARLVVHGNFAARRFVAFWLRDHCLRAAMNIGLQGVPQRVQPLIRSGEPVSDRLLRDIASEATPAAVRAE